MKTRDLTQRPIVFNALVACVALAILASVIGFVVLGQRGEIGDPRLSLWENICRSMGIGYEKPPSSDARYTINGSTNLVWDVSKLNLTDEASRAHGAYIGDRCVACHGSGVSSRLNSAPILWGMDQRSIFKQLVDYRDGRRHYPLMNQAVAGMDDQALASVSAYFASRPGAKQVPVTISPAVTKLIEKGDPKRGLTACSACHGPAGYVTGAPRLFGMPKDYIKKQISAFAVGDRQNDSFQKMRIVARSMTPEEIEQVAVYYSGVPDAAPQETAAAR